LVVTFVKIKALSTQKVGFYTVCLNESEISEFEKFDSLDLTSHQQERDIIFSILLQMGLREAKPYYFRFENGAEALPSNKDVPVELLESGNDFGIRLYCIRLTDNIVILLNGGVKTDIDPKNCNNVKNHFRLAWQLSACINRAKLSGDLNWDPGRTKLEPTDEPINMD
jgi:hypothetical protein